MSNSSAVTRLHESMISSSVSTDPQVFSFGLEQLSDVTVHYQSASFHMHQYVLVISSKYFEALLMSRSEQEHKCLVSDQWSTKAYRRCIELPGEQIGGVDVSVKELHEFFRCLYADQGRPWRERVMSERQTDKWPEYYYVAKMVSTDRTADTATVDSYEIDGIRRHVMKGQMLAPDKSGKVVKASELKIDSWFYDADLKEPKNFHLADYFQCFSMMCVYEKQALVNAQAVVKAGLFYYNSLWKILLLSDRYGWSETRILCLQACSKHKACNEMKHWAKIVTLLKPTTLAELFVLLVNQ